MTLKRWRRILVDKVKISLIPSKASSTKLKPLTVLVRMDPERGLLSVASSALFCLVLGCYTLVVLLTILSLSLEGIPLKLWYHLGGSLDSVFTSLFHPDHLNITQGFYVLVAWFFILVVIATIFLVLQCKRMLNQWKLFRLFLQRDPPQIQNITVGKYLRLTHPVFFHSNVVGNPSSQVLLDVLKEREGLADEWVARVISTLPGDEDEPTEQKFLILLTDRVTFSLKDTLETPVPLKIPPTLALFIAFLATQEKDTWIPKEEIQSVMDSEGVDTTLDQVRQRANNRISNYVRRLAHVLDDENKDNASSKIEIAESDSKGNQASWRLSTVCDVAIFAEIDRFYQSICSEQIQQETSSTLNIADLRVAYQQLKQVYGEGFLSKCKPRFVSPWMQQQYCYYRDRWMAILSYMIEREQKIVENPKCSSQEKHKATASQASMYGAKAVAAVVTMLEPPYGERDLIRCVRLYKKIKKLDDAKDVCKIYVRKRRKADITWSVGDEMRSVWPEAFHRIAYQSKET